LTKIAITGITGRMGQQLALKAFADSKLQVSLLLLRPGHALANKKFLDYPLETTAFSADLALDCDVLIDFTLPQGTLAHIASCEQQQIPIVIGTTGFSATEIEQIRACAKNIPVFFAPNMSMGICMVEKTLNTITPLFDEHWHVEITDLHHKDKKDAPSGTAKLLAQVIGNQRPSEVANVDIVSIRDDASVGEHVVKFYNDFETIEIKHKAHNRGVFVDGALQAAKWLVYQPPGLYSMRDLFKKK